MDVKLLVPGFAVAAQLEREDVAALADAGIRTIINNRPDGEDSSAPQSVEIEAEARRHGLAYRHIPVAGDPGEESVRAFGDALNRAEAPVLAYCRTGTRSIKLWALSQARLLGAEQVLAIAAGAGFPLDSIRRRIMSAGAAAA